MSLASKVNDLADRVADEFNTVRTEIADLPESPNYLLVGILLDPGDPVPGDFPVGGLVFRTA